VKLNKPKYFGPNKEAIAEDNIYVNHKVRII
jgi:hypothetical protein